MKALLSEIVRVKGGVNWLYMEHRVVFLRFKLKYNGEIPFSVETAYMLSLLPYLGCGVFAIISTASD
jgi:hypothetical protein